MNNVSLLTAKSKMGSQSFVLVIRDWEMNWDKDVLQTLTKML